MESDGQRNGAQLLADLLEISLESLKNCLPHTPVSADRQHAGTGFEWISLGNPVRVRLRGDYERLIVASPNDRSGPFVMNAGTTNERLRTDEVGDLMWLSSTLAEAGISFQYPPPPSRPAMWSSDIDEGHLESKFLHATDSTNEFEVEISIPESGVHALPDLAAELPDPESEKPRETRSPFIDLVQLYRTQIAKVPLLSAEREIDLAKRIEAGVLAQEQLETRRSMTEQLRRDLESLAVDGRSAKQEFISANLRLVVSMAPKFAHRGLAFLDLIQEGNQGLIRAVEGFDYTLGYKFSTYASWWIRQAMTRALADQARTIRIPVHMVEEINKVGGAERKLGVVLGRSPTAVEVAIELGISVAKVKALRDYRRDPLSLSFPLPCPDPGFSEFWVDPDERLVELGYLLHDEQDEDLAEGVTYSLLQEQLESVFDTLSDRESGVIQMRFGFSDGQAKTLAEIGHVYGVTRERIRQIEKESMAKLRHPSRSAVLRDYLDPSHSGVPHRATKGLKAHATVEEDST